MALKLSEQKNARIVGNESQTVQRNPGALGFIEGLAENPLVETASNIGVGIGSSIGKTGIGLGQAFLKGVGGLANTMSPGAGDLVNPIIEQAEKIKRSVYEDPFKDRLETTSGKTGTFLGETAAFLAPTRGITAGQTIATNLLSKAPAFTGKGALNIAARAVPEAVGTAAIELARTGGDVESAKTAATLAGGFSMALGTLGALARATYYPELQGSVTKALGIQGKSSGGTALKDISRKVAGLSVIKKYAPDVDVTYLDGTVKKFDPTKADYASTLSAWNATREAIFKRYSDLAKKSGTQAIADLTPIIESIVRITDEPRLSQFHRAAAILFDDITKNFPDYKNANIERLQVFLKDLNSTTGDAFYRGLSDKASAEINAGTAKKLSQLMDEVITGSAGPGYAELRGEYSALKSIEDDLVRKFKQEARSIGGGITDYMNIFSSGEIIGGLISMNPALMASGATQSGLATLRRVLTRPDRFLQRAFSLIDQKVTDPLTYRLFGGLRGVELTPAEEALEQGLLNMSRPNAVERGFARVDLGATGKKKIDGAVVGNGSFEGFDDLSTKLLEKLKGRSTVSRQFIEDLTNSPDLKQPERDLIRRVLGEGADTSPIAKEAKKYSSAEDFVRAQQNPLAEKGVLYHGSPNKFEKFDSAKDRQPNLVDGAGFSFTENPSQAGKYALDDDQVARYRRAIGSEELRDEGYIYSVEPNRNILTLDDTPTTKELNRIDKLVRQKLYKEEVSSWEEKMAGIKDGGTNWDLFDALQRHFGDSTSRVMDDLGYAGIKSSPNEVRIFDPKDITIKSSQKILSKSQLTDIWNKAQGSSQISVPDFANKVKSELLPLERTTNKTPSYEGTTLPVELRGDVANYSEHVYETPFETFGGRKHTGLGGSRNYFGHTRVEELPDGTRRVVEVQTDLYQKKALERDLTYLPELTQRERTSIRNHYPDTMRDSDYTKMNAEIAKLQESKRADKVKLLEPYNDNGAIAPRLRIIREEVKQAAKDGKTKLQFPTGETALKIEGLGDNTQWFESVKRDGDYNIDIANSPKLTAQNLKVGKEVNQSGNSKWIITDVLGDGKFKAVPKSRYELKTSEFMNEKELAEMKDAYSETFDISGKVDTNNPIYKFYEKEVGKYLKNKYGAELVTDAQGVKWWEMNVKPEMKKLPIEAFGASALPLIPATVETKKGNEVTPLPKEWKSEIDKQYKAHPALQKYPGLLEAVLMQESSMGKNDANYNPDIGESAWLVGFTKDAKKELESKGITVDLNTQSGVIKAMADYLDLKSTVVRENGDKVVYKDPVNLYNQRYKTVAGIPLNAKNLGKFRDYIEYFREKPETN